MAQTREWFWPATGLLLAVMGGLQFSSALQENQTLDEGSHLVAGYSYWLKRDFRLSPEHPPLVKLLYAAPLLVMQPDFPEDPELWGRADVFALGSRFLYRNRIPPETLLLAARCITIVLTLGLGLLLALWMRREFSSAAAIFGLVLFAFDPNLIAHGRYITTDLPVTLLFFAACLSWHGYLTRPSTWRLYRTGLIVALALATKFSALLLVPALFFVWLAKRVRIPLGHALVAFCLLPFLIIWSTYLFDTGSIGTDPILQGKQTEAELIRDVQVPAYYWFRGLHLLLRYDHSRPAAYLMGELKEGGSWLYFPTALAVKTPLGTLLAIGLALFFGRRYLAKYPVLWIPPTVYFAASLVSSINIGVRHILPVYPFLFAFAGAVLFDPERQRNRPLATFLAASVAIASLLAYPHYLPYFNAVAGGSQNGVRYLLDSNLDWGQDLVKLRDWAVKNDFERPDLVAYFGGADPKYYGFQFRDPEQMDEKRGLVAISAHYLYTSKDGRYNRLLGMRPVARVGHSIFVYDLGSETALAERER